MARRVRCRPLLRPHRTCTWTAPPLRHRDVNRGQACPRRHRTHRNLRARVAKEAMEYTPSEVSAHAAAPVRRLRLVTCSHRVSLLALSLVAGMVTWAMDFLMLWKSQWASQTQRNGLRFSQQQLEALTDCETSPVVCRCRRCRE